MDLCLFKEYCNILFEYIFGGIAALLCFNFIFKCFYLYFKDIVFGNKRKDK